MIIGLLGAGGQMVLFYAVTTGPAYLIFPHHLAVAGRDHRDVVSPAAASARARWARPASLLALLALPLFDFSPRDSASREQGQGVGWFPLSLIVMAMLGRAGILHEAREPQHERREHLLLHDASGLLLAPVALAMTDFSQPINWGADGPCLAAAIQILNAIGALTLVFAFRYGKAIVVSPLDNAGAPLMTAIISLRCDRRDAGPAQARRRRARCSPPCCWR